MTTMRVVGECFFWYRLTRVVPDKFHRAVKRLCVCVCVCNCLVQVQLKIDEKQMHVLNVLVSEADNALSMTLLVGWQEGHPVGC